MSFYDDEINDFEIQVQNITNQLIGKKIKPIDFDEIKIGDDVYITFYPCSQKYLYTLLPKYGQVLKIEKTQYENFDNELITDIEIQIKNYKSEIENLMHPGVSYMGHSLGYDYAIYLVE
jgi:hypothetical protein